MRDFWKEPETKKINKKKIIFTAIIGVILISVITAVVPFTNILSVVVSVFSTIKPVVLSLASDAK